MFWDRPRDFYKDESDTGREADRLIGVGLNASTVGVVDD
jgi:hypothetical protein